MSILKVTNMYQGFGDRQIFNDVSFNLLNGEHIGLVGANGEGKLTLLKSLMGILKPISRDVTLGVLQEIGYYEQEVKLDMSDRYVIDELWDEFPKDNQTQIRTKLARCGLTREHILSTMETLSGGEQAKVRLCKLINKETNILILDEPTNHLDIDAKEELKRALIEYSGSIVLVCHEPEFYKDVATDVWNCEEWSI